MFWGPPGLLARRSGRSRCGLPTEGRAGGDDCSKSEIGLDRALWRYYHISMKLKVRHSRQRYAARARVAKALAHPSRLLMLDALQDGERCVCELTELVGADQSTVSKHLAVLKQAGLVDDRKDGVKMHYRLKAPCLATFWQCVESVLRENLKIQQAAIGS